MGGLAFGLIRGQAHAWADPAAWAAMVVGVVCLVLFPFLMSRRANPLVPLSLFRSRDFTSVNVATFFIYGALYVGGFYQAVLLQGVLGYTALGSRDRRDAGAGSSSRSCRRGSGRSPVASGRAVSC